MLLVLALIALIALAARIDAAPARAADDDAIAMARRYADAITGRAPAPGDEAAGEEDGDTTFDDDEQDGDDNGDDEDDSARDDRVTASAGSNNELTQSANIGDDEPRVDEQLALEDDTGEWSDDTAAEANAADLAATDADAGAADAGAAQTGALAMLDAELDPGDANAARYAADASAGAGGAEAYEQAMRHSRPSPWGRLDFGVSWRQRWTEPRHAPARRSEELWLVATWRR